MRRKLKWLILGPVSATIPLSVLSAAATNTNENTNSNGTDSNSANGKASNSNEEGKNLSPEFEKFSGLEKEAQGKQLKTILERGIKDLHNEANTLLTNTTTKDAQDILKGMYLKKVATYLEKHKDAIIQNPRNNGFFTFYPEIIANSKAFKSMVLTFDSKTYQQVLINAEKDSTNPYKELPFVSSQIEDLKEYSNETLTNTLTKEQFNAKVDEYFKKLAGEFDEIFQNDEDIPTFETTTIDFNSSGDFNLHAPKNYESWDDYIKSKYSSRFLKFDLDQNSKEDENKDKPPSPIIPPLPRIEDPAVKSNEIQNIPSLHPIISAAKFDEFKALTSDDAKNAFIAKYNKNVEKNSPIYFFFENNINTRYKYVVTELKLDSNKELLANVKIEDSVDKNNLRTYSYSVNALADKQLTLATQAANELIRNIFIQLYTALGVNSQIDYQQLVDQELANVLFNMISRAMKNSYKPEYKADLTKIIQDNASGVSTVDLKDNLDTKFGTDINYFVLSTLKNTLINDTYYFALLPNAYLNTFKLISEGIKNKMETIQANLKVLNEYYKINYLDMSWINQGLDVLNDDISFLKGLAINNSFNLYSQYLDYTELTTRINKTFRDLYIILHTEALTNTEENKKAIKQMFESVWAMPQIPYTQPAANKTLLYTLGAIFLSFSLILILIASTLGITHKRFQIKNTRNKTILMSSLASIFLIIAIILLAIGLGGL
ncbi:MSC_0620 family F1-like ATPase-associated subunit [Mycoplasma sp. CR]|uniref:MSC_0620 family F1-like ATPase-associated subunit n=1 Tax=Mycoplasma sp. CR TaxID=3401693 RepID=UPI003AAC0440